MIQHAQIKSLLTAVPEIHPSLLTTEDGLPYIHRDISWLMFNYRVLQEAMDPEVPLFERIKFLAIYSSNLDEFFRVRMANHRNLLRVGKKTKRELGTPPKLIVREIQRIVNKQQQVFSRIFEKQIIPELAKHHIRILRRLDLNAEQREYVESYFRDRVLPFVQPMLLVGKKIRPFLNSSSLYLAVNMRSREDAAAPSEYAIVKIPSDPGQLPRFAELPAPEGQHHIILLDDIVRHNISWMFPGYDILDTYSIKLTRDAELYIDEEQLSVPELVNKIRENLAKRQVGPPSRFVYDREMPREMLRYLMEVFELDRYDLLREGRYHNNSDFFKFPDFGLTHLKNKPLPPAPYRPLEDIRDIFKAIRERDHLLFPPYHAYDSVLRFFEDAADDPSVTEIQIIQYRVARNSQIMQTLMDARSRGKAVFTFVEAKARFDEEANLNWGEKLRKADVEVGYSIPGIKVHAKLALVRRLEEGRPRLYAYLATGNFNEDTAKVYTDLGLFTADERLTNEVARIFAILKDLSNHKTKPSEKIALPTANFGHLLVGKYNLRSGLEVLIDFEIQQAKAGHPASMILKMNSLEDSVMIRKLYEASQAGVKIQLIIRGICCLSPGVKGLSDNIEAISIVDRYLEHARVFVFHHAGEELVYLSSADWMVRNLTYRIETAFPIYDKNLKTEIRNYLRIQLNDNVKARLLDADLSNAYAKNENDHPIRSQLETYYYVKRQSERLL